MKWFPFTYDKCTIILFLVKVNSYVFWYVLSLFALQSGFPLCRQRILRQGHIRVMNGLVRWCQAIFYCLEKNIFESRFCASWSSDEWLNEGYPSGRPATAFPLTWTLRYSQGKSGLSMECNKSAISYDRICTDFSSISIYTRVKYVIITEYELWNIFLQLLRKFNILREDREDPQILKL